MSSNITRENFNQNTFQRMLR